MGEDESHQHAVLTPRQIDELVTEARAMVLAIDNDEDNPVAAPFLDRLAGPFPTDNGIDEMIDVQHNAIDALIDQLDRQALALVQLDDRRTELLAMVRAAHQAIPYAEEANAVATLIAEVGTLRARVRELEG